MKWRNGLMLAGWWVAIWGTVGANAQEMPLPPTNFASVGTGVGDVSPPPGYPSGGSFVPLQGAPNDLRQNFLPPNYAPQNYAPPNYQPPAYVAANPGVVPQPQPQPYQPPFGGFVPPPVPDPPPANPYGPSFQGPPPTDFYPTAPFDPTQLPPTPAEAYGPTEEEGHSFLDPFGWTDQVDWLDPIPYDGSVELGVNGSSGNADSFSLRAGAQGKHEDARSITEFKITYARTSRGGVVAQDNGLATGKYEWLFPESSWSLFTKSLVEYDKFKNWDVRLVTNAGVGYHFIRNDVTKFAVRAGAGISREVGGAEDVGIPEAVFGFEFQHKFNPKHKFTAKSEYLPAFEDFSDYRVISDVSWEILLDQYTNLSLKFSIIDRYDSTPHWLKPNDVDYAMLLLWKI